MGFLDRILGTEQPAAPPQPAPTAQAPQARSADEQALERYRYMLKTAPPETIEQAHAEAFAQLTPEQRRQVLAGLAAAAPPQEQAAASATSPDDPAAMGRLATRTEMRQPGFMERNFGGDGGGFGGSLLGTFAMSFLGTMVAQSFFSSMGGWGHQGHDQGGDGDGSSGDGDHAAGAEQASNDAADPGGDMGDGMDADLGGDMDLGGGVDF